MIVTLPSIRGTVDVDVYRLLSDLVTANNEADHRIAALENQLRALPHIFSMADIAKGLSSSGTNPLNLTNLIGKPIGQ